MTLFAPVLLLALLSAAISAPPPAHLALLTQPSRTTALPLHLRNVTHSACCITPGLTFDPCTTTVPCAYGRYCVTPDSLHPCPPGVVCICYPAHIILCQDPAHCPLGETCAYRPHDHHPFCVSINVVDVDPSYLIVRGGCVPCSTSRPPTTTPYKPVSTTSTASHSPSAPTRKPPTRTPPTKPPTTQPPTTQPPTTQPPTTQPPTTQPPTTQPPTTQPPSTQPPTTREPSTREPTTQQPTTRAPSTVPPTRPETAIQPSKRPSPTPLESRPPSPRPSPAPPPKRPSHRPVITVVSPVHRPSPPPVTSSTPPVPSDTPKGCLAGDPCSPTSPCCGYRKCKRKETLEDCKGHSDCICIGSRVCVCNDQCTDGEVCAGAPGKSYCFSPRLIDALSWSTTLPCVGPAFSPEVGGATRPPTTTPPPAKIPGLTGEICRADTNCRSPRKCIAGGGESCLHGQILCDRDPTPCRGDGSLCYCYALNTCNCNNDCKETEICTATIRGRICVSRVLQSQSDNVQAIECPGSGRDDGKPILIVNEPVPIPPVALTRSPRPTPSPVRLPGVTPEVASQDVGGAAGVCIDVRALHAFQAHQLVFEHHLVARVLCDGNDSCATPGHLVVFHGNAMMMKTYCSTVGCTTKILQVNSPRLKRRVRVASKTNGLEFTAFAARYATKTEEVILAVAVRVGL